MSEPWLDALTRRRLGGAVLLLAAIVVAALVLWPGKEGDPAAAPKRLPFRIVSVPPLGIGFAHPRGWQRTVRRRVLSLRSPDRSTLMFFSSPVARPAREQVKDEAERALLRRFAPARVVREAPGSIGNRPAAGFELRGRDRTGVVRALVLVTSTVYRTYAVTILTGPRPSRRRLREAAQIVGTVRFSRPLRRKR
jgi:hypothetical protein